MTSPARFQPQDKIAFNLLPDQYQFNNLVFGRGTTVAVETCDVKPYGVDNQEFQVSFSNEKRFGRRQLKPDNLEITFHVLNNKLLPPYEDLIPNFWQEMPRVEDFSWAWREENYLPGGLNSIDICGTDGVIRSVYGLPGEFTYGRSTRYTESVQCLGQWIRADTLAYTRDEEIIQLSQGDEPAYLTRLSGDGPDTWLALLLVGPMDHPIITIGDEQIELDYNIAANNAVEISSYPWQRRAVDSNRVNVASKLIGKTTILEKLKIPYGVKIPVRWTADDASTFIPDLGDVSFLQDIDQYGILSLPNTYTTIHGNVWVKFDLFNFSSVNQFGIPKLSPRKYLGAGLFETRCAIIYNAVKFKTKDQYTEAQIVNPRIGKSAICIMSTTNMNSLVCAEVQSEPFNEYLNIRSGSYDSLTTRAYWKNEAFLGWSERDKVGIGYKEETKTYTAYVNGNPVCDWIDEDEIIPTGDTHRSQGFIFDTDATLLTEGPGFCNSISYDKAGETANGKVYLFWRDSWSTVD